LGSHPSARLGVAELLPQREREGLRERSLFASRASISKLMDSILADGLHTRGKLLRGQASAHSVQDGSRNGYPSIAGRFTLPTVGNFHYQPPPELVKAFINLT
jgi:hypothetical protein